MEDYLRRKKHFTSFQIILMGFAGVILIGTFFLLLPLSSRDGEAASFQETLFTSVSAVCVTGLVVRDTAVSWSGFGQAVILVLIQIGGMGVITVAAALTCFSGRKVSLMQQSTMQEAIAAPKLDGMVRLTTFIIKGTFLIESIGALVMMPGFCRDYGARGIWMAVFHSISAFCNAGFDLMGTADRSYASLTAYAANPVINITVMLLIIIGGIGFLTWEDICGNGLRFSRYRMQSKVILTTSLLLVLLPAAYFYQYEFCGFPLAQRLFYSLFQSVTPRTAGFNTADLTELSGAGQSIVIALMLIGGSPGSTAGGMKTTTLAVLLANEVSVFLRKESPQMFGRRIEPDTVRNAATIGMMYLALFFGGALIISISEGLPMGICLFETASAVGTVGLTLGITPGLGALSRMVLIVLMFFGRVGGLTLIYAALSGRRVNVSRLPQEKIMVG